MSRLTRDGTAEPVSRYQILRRERGQGNIHFPCSADHEQDWQPCLVDPYRLPPPLPPSPATSQAATYLVPGRPQAGQVSAGDMRYYVVHPESDSATLTATLTKSHGEADLYLTKRETSTTKIDPTDESTFR